MENQIVIPNDFEDVWQSYTCPSCGEQNWMKCKNFNIPNIATGDIETGSTHMMPLSGGCRCFKCNHCFWTSKLFMEAEKGVKKDIYFKTGVNHPRYEICRAGTAVFITDPTRPHQTLLGQRAGGHDKGTWCLPGGKPEFGENPDIAIIRETEEETGYHLQSISKLTWNHHYWADEVLHYCTMYYIGVLSEAEWGTDADTPEEKHPLWTWVDPRKIRGTYGPLMKCLDSALDEINMKLESIGFFATLPSE